MWQTDVRVKQMFSFKHKHSPGSTERPSLGDFLRSVMWGQLFVWLDWITSSCWPGVFLPPIWFRGNLASTFLGFWGVGCISTNFIACCAQSDHASESFMTPLLTLHTNVFGIYCFTPKSKQRLPYKAWKILVFFQLKSTFGSFFFILKRVLIIGLYKTRDIFVSESFVDLLLLCIALATLLF